MMENDNVLSEAASKKRKRGRPRVINRAAEKMVNFVSPDIKTVRGKQDTFYCLRAVDILMMDSRFTWIVDPEKMKAGTGGWKKSILSELGRIWNHEDLKAVALRICELKPKTKDAVAMIRLCRTRKGEVGDADGLYRAVRLAVNNYLQRHPGTPWAEVESAFLSLLEAVREKKEGMILEVKIE
jgi:hypothetical protein